MTPALLLVLCWLQFLGAAYFASIAELGAGAGRYFTEKSHDYLAEKGRGTSFWFGPACKYVGVEDGASVTLKDFQALERNEHAVDGHSLIQRQSKQQKRGTEIVLAADKSVAVVGLLGPPAARRAVEASFDTAVRETLTFADSITPRLRGAQGRVQDFEAEKLWAVFRHDTNRLGQLHPHYHCCNFHVARSADGTLGRTERRVLYDNLKRIGAHLRHVLARELETHGFELERTVSPSGKLVSFRIAGFPPELVRELSGRRRQIENELARAGRNDARSAAAAARKTRDAKAPVSRSELSARTRATCMAFGVDEHDLERMCRGVLERERAKGVSREAPGRHRETPQHFVPTREVPLPTPTMAGYLAEQLRPRVDRRGRARVWIGETVEHVVALNQGAQRAARTAGRLGMRSVAVHGGRAHVGERVRLRWRYREAKQRSSHPLERLTRVLLGREPKRADKGEQGKVTAIVDKRVFGLFTRRILVVKLDQGARTWMGLPRKRVVRIRASRAHQALELGYAIHETSSQRENVEPVRVLAQRANERGTTPRQPIRPRPRGPRTRGLSR